MVLNDVLSSISRGSDDYSIPISFPTPIEHGCLRRTTASVRHNPKDLGGLSNAPTLKVNHL